MATLTITVNINDTDQNVLKHDLKDINDWVQLAVSGKINKSWKRFQNEWTAKLMNDDSFTDAIPSNKADFIALVLARADYKNRAQRGD